jgi:hypothetical protein
MKIEFTNEAGQLEDFADGLIDLDEANVTGAIEDLIANPEEQFEADGIDEGEMLKVQDNALDAGLEAILTSAAEGVSLIGCQLAGDCEHSDWAVIFVAEFHAAVSRTNVGAVSAAR